LAEVPAAYGFATRPGSHRNLDDRNYPIYYEPGDCVFAAPRCAVQPRASASGHFLLVSTVSEMPPIAFQVLAAVVVLFVIFLTYMSTKTWRWVHVTFMFLVFAASFTFCIYAAMVLKTRAAWVKNLDKLETDYARAADDLERTTRGDPKDFEGKTESLISVREELGRTILDRGRVWRGCMVAGINRQTGAISLQTAPPADPNNPGAGGAKKHNIQAKTVVHAFREAEFRDPQNPEKVTIVPASYIGEFRVTPVNDQTITLEATMPLGPDQQAAATVPGSWALYETAPLDGHEWLATTKDDQNNIHVLPLEGALQLAMQAERVQFTPAAIQQILQPYLRDGSQADPTTDAPENVWYRVIFDQEYEVTVDAPIVNSIDTDPFNTEGQAVLQRLRRRGATPDEPGKVTFGPKEGQVHWALLDSQSAQALIDRGVAKLDPDSKPMYRRRLTDYERRFHAINEGITDINGSLKQLDLDNKAMIASTQKANEQRALVEQLKAKANEDLAKVKYESGELEKYLARLSGSLAAKQTELSELYQSNKTINRELSELTARLTDEINRRTREATAQNP
jgi:hypothetical protein